MANITNRSPWIANAHRKGEPTREFRLKSKALEYLATFGHTDPALLTRKYLKQLETAFEVQIKLKDKAGEIVKRPRFGPLRRWRTCWKQRSGATGSVTAASWPTTKP